LLSEMTTSTAKPSAPSAWGAGKRSCKTRDEHDDALVKMLRDKTGSGVETRSTKTQGRFGTLGQGHFPACRRTAAHWLHLFRETGRASSAMKRIRRNYHVPMRIAFERGRRPAINGAWITTASGNFGGTPLQKLLFARAGRAARRNVLVPQQVHAVTGRVSPDGCSQVVIF